MAVMQFLNSSKYREVAKTCRSFAAYVMNFCVKGYNTKLLINLDVLKDTTIFDSNNTSALLLNESNLKWCCSGNTEVSEVKFVSVPFAYQFNMHILPPQLVLRRTNNNMFGVQAIVCSLLQMNDKITTSSLEEYKNTVTPDQNAIINVKEILKSKVLQYVPVQLKDVNDLLL